MGMNMGGQPSSVPGGGNFDEVRRRMGGVPQNQGGPQRGPDVMPGGQNPRPPGGPTSSPAPVDFGGQTLTMPQGGPGQGMQGGVGVGNPYAGSPAGGEGPKSAPANNPGQGGQQTAAPGSDGGGYTQTVKPGASIGPKVDQPTPQNPSPQGPRGNAGPVMRPTVGARGPGGFTPPSWGGVGSGSQGGGNVPNPYDQPRRAVGPSGGPGQGNWTNTPTKFQGPMPMPPPQQPPPIQSTAGPGNPYGNRPAAPGGPPQAAPDLAATGKPAGGQFGGWSPGASQGGGNLLDRLKSGQLDDQNLGRGEAEMSRRMFEQQGGPARPRNNSQWGGGQGGPSV